MPIAKLKPITQKDKRHQFIQKAMPDVKKLVKTHGLPVIYAGVMLLKIKQAKLNKAKQLRAEAASLERGL